MTDVKAREKFSFTCGFVQDRETIRLVAQVDELSEGGSPNSTLMKLLRSTGERFDFHLPRTVTAIWVFTDPAIQMFAMAPDGRVLVGSVEGQRDEHVDPGDSGPRLNGPLRDLVGIGGSLFSVGARRQVYKREVSGGWRHLDEGILEARSTEQVSVLNALDGWTSDHLIAVGFGGEIWEYQEQEWSRIESPTNVILNDVKICPDGTVFAAGQQGVLVRGVDGGFEIVQQTATEEQLWSLEWFRNFLYVSSSTGVWRLAGDDELESVLPPGNEATYGFLHADKGVLLSVGRKDVLISEDGEIWTDITP